MNCPLKNKDCVLHTEEVHAQGSNLYLIFDERARLMPNEQCVCLLATDDKKEALEFAEENRGVVFGYITQGDKILNETEEKLN